MFQIEWPDFRFANTYTLGTQLPPVIIAAIGNRVIGGLAYSRFQEPHQNHDLTWLNAVFVSSEYRGRGIASELINRGVNQMPGYDQNYLYVYTNVPPLYQSLGWSVVDIESEPNHSVMSISLKQQPTE